jgi:3-deoxy-D-manno-octulosonic-acid transferase
VNSTIYKPTLALAAAEAIAIAREGKKVLFIAKSTSAGEEAIKAARKDAKVRLPRHAVTIATPRRPARGVDVDYIVTTADLDPVSDEHMASIRREG